MYKARGRGLVHFARGLLKAEGIPDSRVSAEDIVQDAIVITLVNSQKYPVSNPGSYASRVIVNLVRDEARRKGVADPLHDPRGPAAEHRKVLWVSQVEEDVDGRLDAEKVLREMSPQQRRLILLAKGVGFSHS
ncbi:sigma-70 family RNA polymerase sigma factor [Streptomyces sp. BR123]|jgi:DNA-directed RNA polymerase specialized sigma24 family protein|nr:sigma-70 family RNA polymerase sigma factor [Streptomyces sp. BR123]